MGVSLSGLGLQVVGGRLCADGQPHEAHTELLRLAAQHGEATGHCFRCHETITIKRMEAAGD
jgi:hypothetical protein